MLILGLDPGSLHTGYGLVERRGTTLLARDWGRISVPRGRDLPRRLADITASLEELLDRDPPDLVVLEAPFHGRSSRSLIVLAQARGALLACLARRGHSVVEYSPAEVKSAVTGNGRADKQQVARMVRLALRMEGEPLAEDASDALAVAICCAQRYRMDSRVGALC
ncbi:MAG TPA: crossover junction endodeoxyribonuclease RuvC [Thermoanaerobaculia bacterium]|nr:crossover junction endodeoxyribonuclease RuvC [Thermoanaerobaculia bacterium]